MIILLVNQIIYIDNKGKEVVKDKGTSQNIAKNGNVFAASNTLNIGQNTIKNQGKLN